MTASRQITAGFMPLLDSAILVAAKEMGFADAEGVDLTLVRETSWANIRDRLAVGHFDAAHVLAPMPIACNLGLTPLRSTCIAPMALGLGGNAVTVSNALWADMAGEGAAPDLDPRSTGEALARVATARAARGPPRLRFAVVHPHSGHNYELRYWLAACGLDPARDIDIVIVPPPLMAEALATGAVDGYCVGEPWNTAAVIAGAGRIATVKAAIWRSSPEKVLGVGAAWARDNSEALAALLRALCRAAQWCGEAANRTELAAILSGDAYLARPAAWLTPALSGELLIGSNDTRAGAGGAGESTRGDRLESVDLKRKHRRVVPSPLWGGTGWGESRTPDAGLSPAHQIESGASSNPSPRRAEGSPTARREGEFGRGLLDGIPPPLWGRLEPVPDLIREGGESLLLEIRAVEEFFVPFAKAATFPWRSHALWFYSQMVRWGQIEHSDANAGVARETYRPDIYREALKPLGIALPAANAKVEGALMAATPVGSAGASLILGPDGFFDDARFDPDRLDAYIEGQARR